MPVQLSPVLAQRMVLQAYAMSSTDVRAIDLARRYGVFGTERGIARYLPTLSLCDVRYSLCRVRYFLRAYNAVPDTFYALSMPCPVTPYAVSGTPTRSLCGSRYSPSVCCYQTVRRNFPFLVPTPIALRAPYTLSRTTILSCCGNVRYLFESIRPEIRQYFIQSDQVCTEDGVCSYATCSTEMAYDPTEITLCCHALCRTERGYAATVTCGTEIGYAATVMCGTEIGYAATVTCGTEIGYAATVTCGTEIGYAATRMRSPSAASRCLPYQPTRICLRVSAYAYLPTRISLHYQPTRICLRYYPTRINLRVSTYAYQHARIILRVSAYAYHSTRFSLRVCIHHHC
eukprot:20707-Rhodomonas_salina.1